jgi:hypothetical protein
MFVSSSDPVVAIGVKTFQDAAMAYFTPESTARHGRNQNHSLRTVVERRPLHWPIAEVAERANCALSCDESSGESYGEVRRAVRPAPSRKKRTKV